MRPHDMLLILVIATACFITAINVAILNSKLTTLTERVKQLESKEVQL